MANDPFHAASRRRFLRQAATAATLIWPAAVMADSVCYDRSRLGDLSLRRSINYRDVSPDTTRACGGCAFFAASSAGCGKCMLLSGSPVTAMSICDNWAAKA